MTFSSTYELIQSLIVFIQAHILGQIAVVCVCIGIACVCVCIWEDVAGRAREQDGEGAFVAYICSYDDGVCVCVCVSCCSCVLNLQLLL